MIHRTKRIVTNDSRRQSKTARAIAVGMTGVAFASLVGFWLGPKLVASSINIQGWWIAISAVLLLVAFGGASAAMLAVRCSPTVERSPVKHLDVHQRSAIRRLRRRWPGAARRAGLSIEKSFPDRVEVAVPRLMNIESTPPGVSAEVVCLPGIAPDEVCGKAKHLSSALRMPVRLESKSPHTCAMTLFFRSPLENIASGTEWVTRLFEGAHTLSGLPYGQDEYGRLVAADFTILPHMLLGGRTGAGKSAAVNALLTAAITASMPCGLVLIDPKRVELRPWRRAACRVATEPDDLAIAMSEAQMTMRARYEFMERHEVRNLIEQPEHLEALGGPILIVVDELTEFLTLAGKQGGTALSSIAQLGRACGVFLVIATQNPRAELFSKSTGTETLRANLPSRVALATATADDSRVILGSGSEADASTIPPSLPGAFLRSGGGRALARVPYLSDRDIEKVVAAHPCQVTLIDLQDLAAAPKTQEGNEHVS